MINFKENERLNMLNHSCAHMMAQAVKHLFPDAKFWVGPVVEEGFYYDIDLGDKVINEEDIEAISKEMKKIAKDGKRIVRQELTKEEYQDKLAISISAFVYNACSSGDCRASPVLLTTLSDIVPNEKY